MDVAFALAISIAYMFFAVGFVRLGRWWINREDARLFAEFRAQCMEAEAQRLRAALRHRLSTVQGREDVQ